MFKRTRIGTAAALAVGGALLPLSPAVAQLERVEITGRATRSIAAETALPVTVITKDEIQKSGATTAAELLDRISSNNGQGYNQVLAIGDGARPGFAGASLRGLGSNTTLVLLNGRRLAVYAFEGDGTDLNSIALGAIERVEVLRDGASALYGTDAIAGVINFITRRDFRGFDINATGRKPQDKGGASHNISLTGGLGDLTTNRFNVFANLTYDKYDDLKAADREFSKTAFLPNAPGGPFDRTSGNTFPASIVVPGIGTVNPGTATGCLPPFSFSTTPGGACRFDYGATIDILAPQEKVGGLTRATFQLAPEHELFAELNATRTETIFRISPTPASAATTFNGDSLLYPAGGRWYPRAINPATGQLENGLIWQGAFLPLAGDLDIFWRTVDAGPRTNMSTADQHRIVLGGKGTLAGKFDYDAAYSKAVSKVKEQYIVGWLSESKLRNSAGGLLPTDPNYAPGPIDGNINPFGPNDAAGLAALKSAQVLAPVRTSKSTREGVDGKVATELGQFAAGPVYLALGGEWRKETFDDTPLEVLNTGDIIGGGGNQLPVSGNRKITAVYGEVVVQLIKDLELTGQVRHDKYSDFGSTTNPKLALRWAPRTDVLVRGSIGTGFRAPTLPNLYSAVTQTNTGDNYNDPYYEARVGDCYTATGTESVNFNPAFCNAQLTVNQGGNTALRPEESRQQTIGLVLQPTRDITITADLWKIKVKKQIGIPDADARLTDFIQPFLANQSAAYDPTTAKLTPAARAALNGGATGTGIVQDTVTGNLDYVSIQYDNIAEASVNGVDLSINGLIARTTLGEFRGTVDATYIDSYKQDGEELVSKYASFGPVARWRHSVGLDWASGGWGAGVTYRFQSGYRDQGDSRDVAPYELWEVSFAYRGFKDLTLRAGIQNLLDTKPPYSRQGDYFHVGYDPTYGDPRGRTFMFGANYTFN